MANPRLCSIEGCGKPHFGHGWCLRHYARWRRHGDPFLGGAQKAKFQLGEVDRYFKEVVLAHRADECLIWPFSRDRNGYARMHWNGRPCVVSRVACIEVNGPPPTPKHHAAHSCGKGSSGCVAPNHVDWKTVVGNQADRLAHGTSNRGVRSGAAKLNEDDVRNIRALKGVVSQQEIVEQYGIDQSTVSDIQTGRTWAWLE